ncbi:hypothetical protein GOBAR_DD28632 [Gossypium barbadense]|nr:hypothetical protein GOBAR_DD28632 [Gossypium barbadense]
MENMQAVNSFVAAYLKKKGFKEAEQLSEDDVARYQDGYRKLRSWAYGSLDLYKHELLHVLYPVFIHSFMDMVAKGHLQEGNEFARSLRQSKVNIKICQYSYDLLLQYLHKTQSTAMLGVINEHINFQVFSGQPSSISDDADVLLEDSLEERLEKAGGLLSDSEKTEEENEEGDVDETKKRSIEGGKQGNILVANLISAPQRSMVSANLQVENDSSSSEQVLGPNGGKRSYTLFQGHSAPVYSTTFSPLGDFILSSSVDTTTRIWSMDRIQPLRIMAGHLSDVDCVQWHANCNYIATGSSDKTVRLWDVQSGECVRIFIGHRSMILSLAISPDGRYMASGDEDGMIMTWDLSSGRCITPLMGHTSCVWTLGFSCEGSLLASGSADCTIKLWDVTRSTKVPRNEEKSGANPNRLRSLKTLATKSTSVYSLQFSRRNLLFAAGVLSKNM